MIKSNRFWLVSAGLILALAAMLLIAFTPDPTRIESILSILPWAEGLIGVGIVADTHRRMGGSREETP